MFRIEDNVVEGVGRAAKGTKLLCIWLKSESIGILVILPVVGRLAF